MRKPNPDSNIKKISTKEKKTKHKFENTNWLQRWNQAISNIEFKEPQTKTKILEAITDLYRKVRASDKINLGSVIYYLADKSRSGVGIDLRLHGDLYRFVVDVVTEFNHYQKELGKFDRGYIKAKSHEGLLTALIRLFPALGEKNLMTLYEYSKFEHNDRGPYIRVDINLKLLSGDLLSAGYTNLSTKIQTDPANAAVQTILFLRKYEEAIYLQGKEFDYDGSLESDLRVPIIYILNEDGVDESIVDHESLHAITQFAKIGNINKTEGANLLSLDPIQASIANLINTVKEETLAYLYGGNMVIGYEFMRSVVAWHEMDMYSQGLIRRRYLLDDDFLQLDNLMVKGDPSEIYHEVDMVLLNKLTGKYTKMSGLTKEVAIPELIWLETCIFILHYWMMLCKLVQRMNIVGIDSQIIFSRLKFGTSTWPVSSSNNIAKNLPGWYLELLLLEAEAIEQGDQLMKI